MTNPVLKPIFILTKKELATYFNSPIAYIFLAIFLIVGNWLFFGSFFLVSQATMRNYFNVLPWILLFLAPSLTMRLWAEEKKSGTIEFLLTLPIKNYQAVLAKFFGSLLFLLIGLILTLSLPITIGNLGELDFGPVVGGYLGAIFLGGSFLALGLFISSFTKNQIIAFILALAGCFAFFIMDTSFILQRLPTVLAPALNFIGLSSHFINFSKGVIDTKDLIYYLSFIGLFLWLNARVLENRK